VKRRTLKKRAARELARDRQFNRHYVPGQAERWELAGLMACPPEVLTKQREAFGLANRGER